MSALLRSSWFQYALALVAVAIATLTRMIVAPWFLDQSPLLTFLIATVFIAWFCGTGPSLVTATAGFICAYLFFVSPAQSVASFFDQSNLVRMTSYCAISAAIVAFNYSVRRARGRAEQNAADAGAQREQLQVTLASIGDAVIVTDDKLMITFMNDVAVSLTQWPLVEAIGQPLANVFRIVQERTREPADSPAARVLREGQIVALANYTALITREGLERPVEDSAAPIRDARGKITGVVLVFRDVTRRRETEQERVMLAAIVASSQDAIISKTLDGIITSWNFGAQQMYGYRPEEVVGGPFSVLIPPELPDELAGILTRLKQGEQIDHYETVRIAKSGARLDVSASISPLRDDEDRVTGASAIVRDITPRRRAERLRAVRLAATEALAQAETVEQAGEQVLSAVGEGLRWSVGAVWLVNHQRQTLHCHKYWHRPDFSAPEFERASAEATFELGEGLPGRVWQQREVAFVADTLGNNALSRYTQAQKSGLRTAFAVPIQVHGTVLGVIEFWSDEIRVLDSDMLETVSTLGGLVGQFVHRKQAEAALQEEMRITDTLNKIGSRLAAELNPEKLVRLITDEGTKSTGAQVGAFFYNVNEQDESYQLFTVTGVEAAVFEGLPMPRITEIFGPTFQGQRVVRYDDVTQSPQFGKNAPFIELPSGHLAVRSYIAAPVVSNQGPVLGGLFFGHEAVGMFDERDERLIEGIAAQAAIALDNARLYQAVRHADRRKDEFLAMLAHELRNPLAPVRNAVELLRLAAHDPRQVQAARETLERQVQQLVRLVDDLLDVSRIMRGKIELRKERVQLADIIERAVETSRPLIEQRGHEFEITLPSSTVWLEADSIRLAQVVSNLLNNAAKFTENGGRIALTARRQEGEILISAKDNGIGIPHEFLNQIFDLFVQADHAANRAQGGLGIGLTLVRNLVELHGGQVTAASSGLGNGTEFLIRLPVLESPTAKSEQSPVSPNFKQGDTESRILVVDDNVDSATTLAMLLRLSGHDVDVAHRGEAAIEAALLSPPEIAFLDIGMPGMDGYELARRLRQQPSLDGTTLVALTGWGKPEDRELSEAAGFDFHLVKPVGLHELDQIIEKIGKRKGASDPTPHPADK